MHGLSAIHGSFMGLLAGLFVVEVPGELPGAASESRRGTRTYDTCERASIDQPNGATDTANEQ